MSQESQGLKDQNAAVNNHLIIGLGGTGAAILREFRKRLFAAGGRVDSYEGKNAASSGLKKTRFEYLYVDSTDSELVGNNMALWRVPGANLELDKSQALVYDRSGSFKRIIEEADSFPNIKPWIEPRGVFQQLESNPAGAAQRRKLGRLLFAQNINTFCNALRSRVRALQDFGTSAVEIHIVCGLAGGTGSGAVVDAVCQARKENPGAIIKLYCFVPEPNSTWDSDSFYYVNGYAALRDLNALSCGAWLPHDLAGSGERHAEPSNDDPWFNGCILVSDVNSQGRKISVKEDVPRLLADYLFQSTSTNNSELKRAEKSENGTNEPECSPDTPKDLLDLAASGALSDYMNARRKKYRERSKRFMTVGIRRLEVPEEKIKDYLLYNFAKSATLQMRYNNWQDTGFSDTPLAKDLRQLVNSEQSLKALDIDRAALLLERAVISTDEAKWFSAQEYWNAKIDLIQSDITNSGGDKKTWINELATEAQNDYDSKFRKVGVVQFYLAKAKSKKEYVDHIAKTIEKAFFEEWRLGTHSMDDLAEKYRLVIEYLAERKVKFVAATAKLENENQESLDRISVIRQEASRSGFLGDVIAGKQVKFFNECVEIYKKLYSDQTMAVMLRYGCQVVDLLIETLNEASSQLTKLVAVFNRSIEEFDSRIQSALSEEVTYGAAQSFNFERIGALNKTILRDQQDQSQRTQEVRKAILVECGNATNFMQLSDKLTEQTFKDAVEKKSLELVSTAHTALTGVGATHQKVLDVNIIDQLFEQMGTEDAVREYLVNNLIRHASCYMEISNHEFKRQGPGVPNWETNKYTYAVFMPSKESCKDATRYDMVERMIEQNLGQAGGGDGKPLFINQGRPSNEIVLVQIQNLLPLRYFKRLEELKPKYNAMIKQPMGYLVHLEGNGSELPDIFIKQTTELRKERLHFLVLASLLGLVRESENSFGERQLVMDHVDPITKLPTEVVIAKSLNEAMDGIELDLLGRVREGVESKMNELAHRAQRDSIYDQFIAFCNQTLATCQNDKQHPNYKRLFEMAPTLRKELRLDV